jgi:hypothetical protein
MSASTSDSRSKSRFEDWRKGIPGAALDKLKPSNEERA